jgi:hypothetical protein
MMKWTTLKAVFSTAPSPPTHTESRTITSTYRADRIMMLSMETKNNMMNFRILHQRRVITIYSMLTARLPQMMPATLLRPIIRTTSTSMKNTEKRAIVARRDPISVEYFPGIGFILYLGPYGHNYLNTTDWSWQAFLFRWPHPNMKACMKDCFIGKVNTWQGGEGSCSAPLQLPPVLRLEGIWTCLVTNLTLLLYGNRENCKSVEIPNLRSRVTSAGAA